MGRILQTVKIMVKSLDKRLLVETVKCLYKADNKMNLKDLHDVCPQAKKHKTIRQYGSILRLKGEFIEYDIDGMKVYLIGWREGPEKIYALSHVVEETNNISIQRKLDKLKDKEITRSINVQVNHRP
jgi:hypothetical protein